MAWKSLFLLLHFQFDLACLPNTPAHHLNLVQNIGNNPNPAPARQQEEPPFPQWGPWYSWSDCSATCGDGVRTRARTCMSRFCEGQGSETEECNLIPCAEWSTWFPWATCSKTCGSGVRKRERACLARDGEACPGQPEQLEECENECEAAWDPWENWTECSVTCGTGSRSRVRHCPEGKKCPDEPSTEEESCSLSECGKGNGGEDWASWSPWAPCSATCGWGLKDRARNCLSGKCDGEDVEETQCNLPPCSEWESWSQWGQCSTTCDSGIKTRSRKCSSRACKGDSTETEPCQNEPCSHWSLWTPWGPCSSKCGVGTATRTRQCSQGNCDGPDNENKVCSSGPCPEWAQWGAWSACLEGNLGSLGSRLRRRTCLGGSTCQGPYIEYSPCPGSSNSGGQGQQGQWGQWFAWSECSSAGCQEGLRTRSRQCLSRTCAGVGTDTQNCTSPDCQTKESDGTSKNIIWQLWSHWSACSRSCGPGTQQRTRGCLSGACKGPVYEGRPCYSGPCQQAQPQAAPQLSLSSTWLFWGPWGPCSKSCGFGTQARSRTCPTQNCGSGPRFEGKPCDLRPCSVQRASPTRVAAGAQVNERPEWSNWGSWSECSVPCGRGRKQRRRACFGGLGGACVGRYTEITDCTGDKCF